MEVARAFPNPDINDGNNFDASAKLPPVMMPLPFMRSMQ